MPTITISIDEKVKKILEKRAKKNLMTLREQIENIIRRSAANYKSGTQANIKADDKLVEIFSRHKKHKGRRKKKRK